MKSFDKSYQWIPVGDHRVRDDHKKESYRGGYRLSERLHHVFKILNEIEIENLEKKYKEDDEYIFEI